MPTAAPLVARAVTATRGAATILDSVDLTVAVGDVIGLVGPNGVGKSTLLAVLGGALEPESGAVELTPPTATVGLLPQEPHRDDGELVVDFVARRTGITCANAELDAATAALAAGAPESDTRYDDALQRWLSLGAADLDARIGEVWAELGLAGGLLGQPTATLSGGEAARVGLAALLLSRFDAYLLDEPTNDLDLDGLDRLERWVTDQGAGIVVVSHDRTFLSRTVNAVVEIDEFTHRATRYSGGWDAYLEERATAERHAWERFEDYDAKRGGLAERAQREREWASQGQSKVRKSDEKDKNIRAFRMNQTEQLAGRAARTEKAMERLDVVDKPRAPWQLRFVIGAAGRSGDVVSRLDGVVVRRGLQAGDGGPESRAAFTLGPVDLVIGAGERVALLGANGSGKSTLLDVILGRIEPDEGAAHLGAAVVVGEVEQVRRQLTGSVSLLRAFQNETGYDASDARTLLAKFGLVAGHVLRPAESLSPGERTRASLALLMARQVNLLVLDEPTNHLDLPAIESLEQALDTFPGTVLLVTHDRSLLERVRLTRTVRLDAGRVVDDSIVQPV